MISLYFNIQNCANFGNATLKMSYGWSKILHSIKHHNFYSNWLNPCSKDCRTISQQVFGQQSTKEGIKYLGRSSSFWILYPGFALSDLTMPKIDDFPSDNWSNVTGRSLGWIQELGVDITFCVGEFFILKSENDSVNHADPENRTNFYIISKVMLRIKIDLLG